MKKFLACLAGALLWAGAAFAQSSPNLTQGQIPTAGQWNSYFAAKQDYLGYIPVNRGGDTMFGPLKTYAPTGAQAGLVVTPGLVPSAPANGSIWFTASGMYIQVNGATLGPIGAGGSTVTGPGTSVVGHIATWNNTSGSVLADSGRALPSGTIVGTTDAQTLTNKSIDASEINSGTLGVPRGGTGATSLTANGALYGGGTGAIAATAALTNGQLVVGQTSAAPLPKTVSGDATLAASGALTVASIGGNPPGTSANNLVQLNGSGQLPAVSGVNLTGIAYPPGTLFGLTLSNDGSSPNTVVDIASGVTVNNDGSTVRNMALASAITKSISSTYTAGTGNGCLDTGSVAASTWYSIFVIQNNAGSVTDVLCSASATSPTMPSGYTARRRIGALRTNGSSNFLAFTQISDRFIWAASVVDASSAITSASAQTVTLTVPSGVNVLADIEVQTTGSTITTYVSSLLQNDEAPTADGVTAPGYAAASGTNAGSRIPQRLNIMTNTSSQIRFRNQSTTSTTVGIFTYGWVDFRGK